MLNNEINPVGYDQKRYGGTPANLRYQVGRSGVKGEWVEHRTALYFKLEEGGGLFWYPKDSSIELLGATDADKALLVQVIKGLAG